TGGMIVPRRNETREEMMECFEPWRNRLEQLAHDAIRNGPVRCKAIPDDVVVDETLDCMRRRNLLAVPARMVMAEVLSRHSTRLSAQGMWSALRRAPRTTAIGCDDSIGFQILDLDAIRDTFQTVAAVEKAAESVGAVVVPRDDCRYRALRVSLDDNALVREIAQSSIASGTPLILYRPDETRAYPVAELARGVTGPGGGRFPQHGKISATDGGEAYIPRAVDRYLRFSDYGRSPNKCHLSASTRSISELVAAELRRQGIALGTIDADVTVGIDTFVPAVSPFHELKIGQQLLLAHGRDGARRCGNCGTVREVAALKPDGTVVLDDGVTLSRQDIGANFVKGCVERRVMCSGETLLARADGTTADGRKFKAGTEFVVTGTSGVYRMVGEDGVEPRPTGPVIEYLDLLQYCDDLWLKHRFVPVKEKERQEEIARERERKETQEKEMERQRALEREQRRDDGYGMSR
ncbi:MAG: DUF1682 domain-containing protein, partial [Victivallaceae bacterium]|nr:DUF1682 domain-containing protein [Victivallaceae bacterium]